MTVGRVMLAATQSKTVLVSCDGRNCHQCVACATARLNKCREDFEGTISGALSRKLRGDDPYEHIQQTLNHSSELPGRVREASNDYFARVQIELALREPEPAWNDEPYTYAMHRESRRGERKQ